MKKLIITAVAVCALTFCATFVGVNSVQANKGWLDFNYEFNYCQIKMPDGSVVEGKVYLTHASNMVLMYK